MKKQPTDLVIIALGAILLFLCLYACKPIPVISRSDTVTKTIVKEVLRDTTIYISDSAGFRALLECDSLGAIRVKQIEQYYAGQFVKPKIIIKDNFVNVTCKIDSAKVAISWNERHTVHSEVINTVVVEKINYVTGFQWFQIWTCRVLLAAGALVGLYFALAKSTWWATLISWATGLVTKLWKKKD